MKCSRVALFLMLTALGRATMALAANDATTDLPAKTALPPASCLDVSQQADVFASAMDWRDGELATEADIDGLDGVAEGQAADKEEDVARTQDNSIDSDYDHYYGSDAYRAAAVGVHDEEESEEQALAAPVDGPVDTAIADDAGMSTTSEQTAVGSESDQTDATEQPNSDDAREVDDAEQVNVEGKADDYITAPQAAAAVNPDESNTADQFVSGDAGKSNDAERGNAKDALAGTSSTEQSRSDGSAGEIRTFGQSNVENDDSESDMGEELNRDGDADPSDSAEQPSVEGSALETDAPMRSDSESDAGEPSASERSDVEDSRDEPNAAEQPDAKAQAGEMWEYLTSCTGLPTDELSGAFRSVSRQIRRIDWNALLGGVHVECLFQQVEPGVEDAQR